MVERFTEKAIKVIMLAREEARRLGHNFVGTEQILLGLVGEGTGVAAKTLKSMGVNLKDARVEVEKIIGRGSGFVAVEIPFTPRAKRVLELSWDEARQLGHNYIGTEHLLLGLIREPGSVALDVLATMGVKADRLHIEVEKQLPKGDPKPSQELMLTPRGRRVIDLAYDEARNLFNNYIGTEHLLLALIREGDGLAGRALKKMGVRLEPARKLVKEIQEKVAES